MSKKTWIFPVQRERIQPASIHKVRNCHLSVYSEASGEQNKGLSAHLVTVLCADDCKSQCIVTQTHLHSTMGGKHRQVA